MTDKGQTFAVAVFGPQRPLSPKTAVLSGQMGGATLRQGGKNGCPFAIENRFNSEYKNPATRTRQSSKAENAMSQSHAFVSTAENRALGLQMIDRLRNDASSFIDWLQKLEANSASSAILWIMSETLKRQDAVLTALTHIEAVHTIRDDETVERLIARFPPENELMAPFHTALRSLREVELRPDQQQILGKLFKALTGHKPPIWC
jgi:hypothetical protein